MAFKMKGPMFFKSALKHGSTEDFQYGRNGHNPDIMEGSHEDWHGDKATAEEKGEEFNTPPPNKQKASPVKQTYTTPEMNKKRNDAELAFNKQMNAEGFSSESHMRRKGGASARLLALQKTFEKSREGFVQQATEENDRAKAEKTGLYKE